jgi:hypothetical protein
VTEQLDVIGLRRRELAAEQAQQMEAGVARRLLIAYVRTDRCRRRPREEHHGTVEIGVGGDLRGADGGVFERRIEAVNENENVARLRSGEIGRDALHESVRVDRDYRCHEEVGLRIVRAQRAGAREFPGTTGAVRRHVHGDLRELELVGVLSAIAVARAVAPRRDTRRRHKNNDAH